MYHQLRLILFGALLLVVVTIMGSTTAFAATTSSTVASSAGVLAAQSQQGYHSGWVRGRSMTEEATQSDAIHGCPSGYVCFYPGAGWNNDRPTQTYYKYGTYNLSNMFGTYRIYNNQTGGATMRTCTGYNGSGCQGYLLAGYYLDKDMTPINSITLEP